MKKLIKLAVFLVVLLIGIVVAAFLYIDVIAKGAIEEGATSALGVKTKLRSANVKIFSGEFAMGDLNVANPETAKGQPEFTSEHFLTLGEGGVAVALATLRQDIIELPHLTLANLDINLEKKGGTANYQLIMDNLKKWQGEPPPEAAKYIVRKLNIKNIKVHVDLLGGGDLTKVDVPIDEIVMADIGSDGTGVEMGELAGIIVAAVFKAVVEKGGGLIPADLAGELTAGLAQLGDLTKLADIESLGNVVGELGKAVNLEGVGEKVDDLGNKAKKELEKATGGLGGMGGLLGGDKKDK